METIFSPMRFSAQRFSMGMAPPTEPSNLSMHPFFWASSVSSAYFSASGPLFTVMTSLPRFKAEMMFPSPAPPVLTSVGLTSTRTS